MWQFIIRRLIDAVPTALLVLTLVFLAMRLLPGDPAIAVLGDLAGEEQIARFREKMGLNDPLWKQYFLFLFSTVQGDFGRSLVNNVPIGELLARHLPYTVNLTIGATVIGLLIGLPIGILSAVRRNAGIDYIARIFALIGFSVPDFYLGAILLIVFALGLGWFPIMGGGEGVFGHLYHLFLPALTLGLIKAAFITRLTRSAMLEVLPRDYVRTARSKGLAERRVLYKHALRNALIPVTTGLGIYTLSTLSGSIAIELVFSRPGLGQLLIGAVSSRDYPMIQAGLIVFSLFVVLVNMVTDLLYAAIDPRIRLG
jgi:ABC-type dipeptide/oligopeptide/nickel transport system permease component